MRPPAGRIMAYVITAMLSNAARQRGRSQCDVRVDVAVWRTPSVIAFQISDGGIGIFTRLRLGPASLARAVS